MYIYCRALIRTKVAGDNIWEDGMQVILGPILRKTHEISFAII
jgi:hypothetical protein